MFLIIFEKYYGVGYKSCEGGFIEISAAGYNLYYGEGYEEGLK